MTWVIGACPPLGGYGLMISDIQVTLATGQTFNAIRKAHPVGPYLVLGFSGSVRTGFAMVESLKQFLALTPEVPPNAAYIPGEVAEYWSPLASDVFAVSHALEKTLGCSLLLVGIHPTEDIGMPRARAYVIRMVCPNFRPGYSPKSLFSVLSIGTGSKVVAYRRAMRQLLRIENGLIQAEVMNTGGWGQTIAHAVTMAIDKHAVPGISNHLHIADVRRGSINIYRNDRTDYPKDGPPVEFRMPRTASTYPEFCDMVLQQQLNGAGARC